MIVDPALIKTILTEEVEDMHIIPWISDNRLDNDRIKLKIFDENDLEEKVRVMSSLVSEIEVKDPWVYENFGIEGVGEGLVWYPVSFCQTNFLDVISDSIFGVFAFKTKGSEHDVVQKKSITTKVQTLHSPSAFVEYFATPGRMEQGITDTFRDEVLKEENLDIFVNWVLGDIKKESVAELKNCGFKWENVVDMIKSKATTFYMQKLPYETKGKQPESVPKRVKEEFGEEDMGFNFLDQ